MTIFNALLNSISDVKRFVDAANMLPCDIDVVSGRYRVDAKSLMGMFSLDLTKPVRIEFHGTNCDENRFRALIAANLVDVA